MDIQQSPLPGLYVCTPKVVEDPRGFFQEVMVLKDFSAAGMEPVFVQMNHSKSKPGVLRGLHFQWDPPLGKFIRVLRGTAFMAAVDIRLQSATRGQWTGMELSERNHQCLYAPPGFAMGFCVLGEEDAEVEYLYTAYYNKTGEGVIQWNDPKIGIAWPLEHPQISERDKTGIPIQEWFGREEAKNF